MYHIMNIMSSAGTSLLKFKESDMSPNLKEILDDPHHELDYIIYNYHVKERLYPRLQHCVRTIYELKLSTEEMDELVSIRLSQLNKVKHWYYDFYDKHHRVFSARGIRRMTGKEVPQIYHDKFYIESTNRLSHELKKLQYHIKYFFRKGSE